ncbi:unnamed protein product (macronuclear) [Paramecium tetraurelia]|uniref:C2 NT-type domain-containing protein n=1 Tax=Paramecium tetraurelia TaxID=5888 RepID=A0C0A6_PARTE|nr:uncharacterized protein GSPATT00006076001 [Paramecium tetraurelia]CAK64223.1 unnamed protein product [Paramecium tetraurelia]|eukprot:XP_001431621.1 hypothetical protein (macronuclear) [Paramecium tetraurelia strain d4-2]
MENKEEQLQLEVTIVELSSDSTLSQLLGFQIKSNHATITTTSYEICKGLNPINESHLISLENRSNDLNYNKLELILLLNNEVAGRVQSNLTRLINSKFELQYDNDPQAEIEEEVFLNDNQISNLKVKLRLKVLNPNEEFSQRTTINTASSENQYEQNLVLSQMREEIELWKSKYTNIVKELDSLGDELLALSIKEKGNLYSYLTTEINIFRKIMKSKLQHFLQIHDNQVDQIYLLKKELNSYRSKLCCKCSEPFLKNSSQSLSEKIQYLSSIIDKKQTEYMQLMKSLEVEKQEQKTLQNTIKILNQQQSQLRQALAKSKKQIEDILKLQAQQELENQQLHKDLTTKTQIMIQLNKRHLELEKQNSKMNSDFTEIINLQKQWSLSILKSFENESSEKQQLVDALSELNILVKSLTSKENSSSDSKQVKECQCKIEQYIHDFHLQVTQLEQLLNQYRIKFLNQNTTSISRNTDEQFKFTLQLPLENLNEQGIKDAEISKYLNYQMEQYVQNLIQQKDDEITKLKQTIGDMLNLALELGNSVLIEQMQLTVM